MYHTEFDPIKAVCGIDIGTCNSTAVLFDGETSRIIHHHQQNSMPSIYAIDEDGNRLIGKLAKSYLQFPENCCYETKRFFRMPYDEYQSQKFNYPFKVVPDENQKAAIELEPSKGNRIIVKPQDVAKLIIDTFLQSSKSEYGFEPENIVLTCPVEFDEGKKNLLKGINSKIIDIIPEPQAAAISYLSTNMIYEDTNLLLFDFGAGTLDISIVRGNYTDLKNLKIISNVGMRLGGVDIDNCFAHYLMENYLKDQGEINFTKLVKKCSKAKKSLSLNQATTIVIGNRYISISQEEYVNLMKMKNGIYEKCINLIDDALKEAKMSVDDISHVGFIGGSTQSVGLMEEVRQKFQNLRQPPSIHDRVTAVATGAAMFGSLINHPPTPKVDQTKEDNSKQHQDPKTISEEDRTENANPKEEKCCCLIL